jgi:NTE family protein
VGRGAVDILGKLSALTLRRMQEIPTLKKRQGDIKSPIATFVVHLGKSNVEWIMAGRYDEKGKEYRHSDLLQAFGLSEIAPKLVYGTINGAGPHDPEGSISLLFFDEKYPEENAVVLAMRLAAGGVPATKKVSVMIDQGLVASIHRLSDILPKTENARAKARNKETPTPNTSVLRQKLIKEPATDDAQDPTSSRSEMRGELIVSRDSGLGAGIENESLGTRDEVHAEVRSEARLVPSPAIINRQEIRRVQTVFQEQLRSLLSSPEKISALTPDEIAIGQYSFQLTWDRLSGEWVIKLADFGTAAKAALATNDFGELGALRIDGSNRDDVLLVKQLTKILAVGQQIAAEDPRLTKDPARLAQAFQKIVISLRDHTASGVSPPTQQKQAVAKPSAQGITLDEALGFYARLRRMDQDGLAAQKQLERMSPNERLKLTAQMALGISREPTKEELEAFTGSTIGVRKVSEFPALDTRLKQLNLKDHYAGYVEIDEKALAFLRRAPGGFSKTGKGCMNDAGKYGPLHLNGHETNYFRELGSYVYLKNQFQDAFHESFHHRAGGKAGHPFVQRTSVDDMNGLEEMQAYLGMNLRADGSIDENFPFGSIDQVEGYIDEKNHAKRSEACEFVKVVRRLIQIFPGRDVIHEVGRARSFAKIIEMGRLSDQDLVDLIRPGFTVEELALARQAGYDSRQKAVVELHQEALDRDYLRHLADPTAKKIQDWATQWAEPRVRYLVEMAGRSELWLVIEWLDSQDEHLTLAVAGALGVFGLSAQIIRDRVKALESGANEGQQIRNAVRNAGKGDSHLLGDSQRSEIRAEAKREIKEGKGSVPAGQQVSPERVLMQKKLEASDRIFTEVAQRRTVARKPVQGIAGPVSFETDKGVFKSTDSAYLPLIHLAMQIPQDGSATVLELGSGVGQFAIPFVLLNPRIKKFTGIEYDPVLVEESQEAASLASGDLPGVGLKGFFPEGKVAFKKGDFLAPEFGEDFREADLILYYRFGSSFEFPIEERIAEEAKVGAQFLTYTEHTDQPFAMLPHHPDFQMRILRDGTGKVATVFTRTAKTIGAIAPRESAIGAAIRNIAVRKSPGPMRSEAREETGAAFQVPGVDADDLAVKQAEYIRAITVLLQRHFLIEEIAEAHLEKYTWNLMPVSVDDLFRDEPELNKVLVRYEQIKNAKIFDFFTEWDVDLVYDMDSYAALSKETLPPVIVEQTESGAWKAFDGARRLLAAKLRGDSHINAFVGRLSSSPRTDSARSEMRDKEQRISGVSAIAHAAPPNTEKTLVHSVFEGGGAKGVAYVGALEELESRNMWFKEVAGTSAGAITAALIAAGYTYPEIKKIVFETDFDQFKDRRWGIVPPFLNFMILGGMYRGQVFEEWMSEKLKAKLGVEPRLKDLPIPLTVIASDITNKTMLVLDRDSAPDLKVAEAVRMSMGIPFFFEVYRWKGVYQRFPSAVRRVVDGGLLSNFPLSVYDEAGRRGEPVVGFMLQELPHSKKALSGLVGILVSLLKCFPPLHIAIASIETMQEGNDKRHIKLDVWARIVNIPVDIGTLDFNLTLAKKLEMAARGKEATKKILGLALRGEKGKAVLPKAGQIVKLSGKDSRVYFKPAGFNYGARFDTLDFYRDRDGALQANIRFRPDAKILIQPLAMWEASLGQLKPNGAQWDDAALAEASKSHRKEEFVSFNTEAARRFVLFDLRTRQEAVVDIIELAVDPEQAEKPVLVLNFANDATVKKNRGVVEIVPNSETVSATVAMAGTKPGATRSEMRDSVVKLADVQPKVERKLPVPASDEVVRKAYTALHGAREGEWVSPSGVSYAHRLSNLTEEDDFGKTRVLLEWWLDQVKRVFEKARQAQPTLTKEKFSILELGAADGYLARGLAKKGYSVTGMDFVKTFVKIANQANPYPKTLRFVRGDATNLDGYGDFAGVADASFDLVISNEWLGNVPIFEAQAKAKGKTEKRQVRPVFHEIFQKLKPGGVYILNDYLEKTNRSGITETMRDPLFWWIHYSVADRIRALQEAGFKNVLDAGKVPNGFSKREDDFTHAIIATKPFARSTALETRATSRQARAEMRDREQPIPEAASGTIQEAEKMMRVPWDQWPSKLKAAIQKHGVSPDFAALTRQVTSQKAMNIFSDFYLSGFPRQILDDPEQWAEFIRLAQVYAKPSVEFGEDAPENLEKMIRVLADFQSFGIDLNFLDEIAQHTKSYNRPFVLSMFLKPGPMAGVPFAMDVYEEKIRGASGASYEEFNRFLVFLIAEFSQFSVRIVDGLFEGLDEGIINARLDGAERERIVEFIRLTNGFCLELFRFYKKEGREAVVNLRRRYVGAILRDEIGVKEIKAFQAEMAALGYDGLKIVPAIFQIALPTTGATTLTHHEIQEIFERHLTAGDMRSTLPSQFRHADLLNGKGEIFLKEKVLAPGQAWTEDLEKVLTRVRASSAQENEAEFIAMVLKKEYTAQPARFLGLLLGLAPEPLRITSVEALKDFSGNELLREGFLSDGEYAKFLSDWADEHAELLLQSEPQAFAKTSVAKVLPRVVAIWEQRSFDRSERLGKLLKNISPQDLSGLIGMVEGREDLKGYLKAFLAEQKPSDKVIRDAVSAMTQSVQDLLGKAPFVSQRIPLEMRMVRGPAHALWGANCGTCIGTDWELWKNKSFGLISITDTLNQQVVGYIHLYSTQVNGRKALIVPGIEPRVEFIQQTQGKDFYRLVEKAFDRLISAGDWDVLYLPEYEHAISGRFDIRNEVLAKGYPVVQVSGGVISWSTDPKYHLKSLYLVRQKSENRSGVRVAKDQPKQLEAGKILEFKPASQFTKGELFEKGVAAVVAEAQEKMGFWRRWLPEAWSGRGADALVVFRGGAAMGVWACGELAAGFIQDNGLYISSKARGVGLGKVLRRAMITFLKNSGHEWFRIGAPESYNWISEDPGVQKFHEGMAAWIGVTARRDIHRRLKHLLVHLPSVPAETGVNLYREISGKSLGAGDIHLPAPSAKQDRAVPLVAKGGGKAVETKAEQVARQRSLAATSTRSELKQNVRKVIENLRGKFTVMTDMADAVNFTDAQLREFEAMAVLQANVRFVFYGDGAKFSSGTGAKKHLEQLQRELGADRILITEAGVRDVFLNKGEKVIHISKTSAENRVASVEADLLRRTDKMFSFRYLGEETGLVAMALLYADQHEKPSPKGTMDLSMVNAMLRADLQEFQNSIVFARAA